MSDIDFAITLLLIVILSPGLMLVTLWFWMAVFAGIDWVFLKVSPDPPPYCDIDPRCHPAFVWAPDGSGWIRNIKVLSEP